MQNLAKWAGLCQGHFTFDVKFAPNPEPEAFITGAIAGSPITEIIAHVPEMEHRS